MEATQLGQGGQGYSPFKRVCRVRRVTFPDGSIEALARFIDVQEGGGWRGSAWGRVVEPDISAEARAQRVRAEAERRARKELRYALICIGADRMLTCTFAELVTDHRAARKVWAHFVKLVRAKFPNWQYAVVMELQKRGAIHFHAGVVGWQEVNFLRSCWRRAAGKFGGNIDVMVDKRRFGGTGEKLSTRRIAGYLGKYLGKAFEWMPKHSHRFSASEDRERPSVDRWWIEYTSDEEIIRACYRMVAGKRAIAVRQWLSPDGNVYWAGGDGPPVHEPVPF